MFFKNKKDSIAFWVSINTIIANTILTIIKLLAGILGNSAAMISDAIHSMSDVFSTIIVLIGVWISAKDQDSEHPYGHERIECVTACLLSILLGGLGLGILYDGIDKVIFNKAANLIMPEPMALWAAILSIIVKEGMYWYTMIAAKKINSGALMADAWHHRSDALSSVGALVAIYGARMGYTWMDPGASFIIGIMIMHVAIKIFIDSMKKMIDHSCGEETEQAMCELVEKVPGVIHCDHLHTRMFGNRIYVDVEFSADDNLRLAEAHCISEMVHMAIEVNYPLVKHCMVHVNPASEKDHNVCQRLPKELLPKNR